MPLTPKLQLPYPVLSDPADVPADTGELATRIDDLFAIPSGFAPLDETGKVPLENLPPIDTDPAKVPRRYPVALNVPRVSTLAGNAFWSVAAAGGWDAGRWEFLKDVEGRAYGSVIVPPSLEVAAPDAKLILSLAANATTGVTRMQVATKAIADGESMAPATLTAETAQDITVPATANLRKAVSFNLTEVLAANDLLLVEVTHLGAHANDTLNASTLLFGAWLEVVS